MKGQETNNRALIQGLSWSQSDPDRPRGPIRFGLGEFDYLGPFLDCFGDVHNLANTAQANRPIGNRSTFRQPRLAQSIKEMLGILGVLVGRGANQPTWTKLQGLCGALVAP
jgi:hypothetical protein